MKLLFIFLIVILLANNGFGQWSKLRGGLDHQGKCIYFDSISNNLIVGGNFTLADSILVNHISVWNGFNWDSIGNGAPFGAPIYSITKYNGECYASSVFYNSGLESNWLAKWNGIKWDTITPRVNGAISCFKEYNNELFCGGSFNKIGTANALLIAKYNGLTFSTFPLATSWGSVLAIEFYNGQMYVGGNFYDSLTQVNDLEFYDGSSFHSFVGNGLAFGSDYVSSLAVFNNELYIGGSFSALTGSSGNNIMRWDGTQLKDVGGGLDGYVFKMKVYPDGLYVSGVFQTAGTASISCIAKWDGVQWSKVVPDYINGGISDFVKINNVLYITGSFITIDSIEVNNIARYMFPLAVNEIPLSSKIKIYPNPTCEILQIQSFLNFNKIKITNILGEEIYSKEISGTINQLDISFLTAGIYFLIIETKEGCVVKKFIKE